MTAITVNPKMPLKTSPLLLKFEVFPFISQQSMTGSDITMYLLCLNAKLNRSSNDITSSEEFGDHTRIVPHLSNNQVITYEVWTLMGTP